MNFSGVYKIESKREPERCYVGSALNIGRRWNTHLRDIKNGVHHSIKLQRHCDKYGRDDLMFSIISECNNNKLIETEQLYIDLLTPYFNNCIIAGSQIGLKRTLESREKMRNAKLGKKHSAEHKRKIGLAHLGSKRSKETREKLSIQKMGNKNALGTHHITSDKAKINMSESHKGYIMPEEQKQKIRESMMGKNKTKLL